MMNESVKQEEAITSRNHITDIQPSVSRTCKVCTETTIGSHFGIDACRACAAFFRRSIVEKKRYSCRSGGKCQIDKSIRCLCRKCRLQKCLDVGMQVEGVQGKRDPIIPKTHDPNPLYIGSPSESEIASGSPRDQIQSPPFQVVNTPIPEQVLLVKAIANYKQLCAVRKATELALEPETYKKMHSDGPMAGFVHGTSKHMSLFFRAAISPVTEFVAMTFEEFGELDNDEKWALLQPFFVYLWWYDCAWRTYKLVPREQYTQICVVSETMYLDTDRCDEWIDEIADNSNILKTDFVKYLKKEMSPEKMKISYAVDDMKIRETEWVALVSLMLWNSTLYGATPKLSDCIRRVRSKLYEELHHYYRASNEPSPAVRFGELMNLHSMTMVELMRSREDLEIFNLLDAFKKDDFFYEMVRKIR